MPIYTCKTINRQTGLTITRKVNLEDVNAFLQEMDRQGYLVVSLKEEEPIVTLLKTPMGTSGVSGTEKGMALLELAAFLKAGIPLKRSLEYVSYEAKPALAKSLLSCTRNLEMGMQFHEALLRQKGFLTRWEVEAIKSAEASGALPDCLKYLGEQNLKTADFQGKVKSAMMYPMFVLGVTFAIMVVLVVFVLPMFVRILGGVQNLPAATRALLVASEFMKDKWILLLAVLAGAVFGAKKILARPSVAAVLERVTLRIPVWGRFLKALHYARFTRTLSMLLQSGVPVPVAVEYAGQSSGSHVVEKASKSVKKEVENGAGIGDSMRASRAFPALLSELAGAGENSGALPEMISTACSFYEGEVARMLESLTSMIEPILILLVGLMVAGLAFTVFGPILQSLNLIR